MGIWDSICVRHSGSSDVPNSNIILSMPTSLKTQSFLTETLSVSVVKWLSSLPLDPRFVGSKQAEEDGFEER
jgi:hypothetical protein